ncbi:hypothetical protein ABID56_002554 [Alkalibacillus flavidus]|uniref:Uncharacterized protein n=1 Tax=Alkalibacillus flavidus TaxID=546021 RepID=A0ABV2KXW6_9BACI
MPSYDIHDIQIKGNQASLSTIKHLLIVSNNLVSFNRVNTIFQDTYNVEAFHKLQYCLLLEQEFGINELNIKYLNPNKYLNILFQFISETFDDIIIFYTVIDTLDFNKSLHIISDGQYHTTDSFDVTDMMHSRYF